MGDNTAFPYWETSDFKRRLEYWKTVTHWCDYGEGREWRNDGLGWRPLTTPAPVLFERRTENS